jgi:dipeptidyl aminopeptidase/acylaminoacyl peptidase
MLAVHRQPSFRKGLACLALISLIVVPAAAQNKANWKLAERFSGEALRPFLYGANVNPTFIGKTDVFWYSWKDPSGVRFMIVDPGKKSKRALFDSAKMAAQLSELMHKPYDTTTLPITTINFDEDGKKFNFTIDRRRFEYELATETLKEVTGQPGDAPGRSTQGQAQGQGQGQGQGRGQFGQGGGNRGADFRNFSPDKKLYVYAEAHNLYLVDMADEKHPIQLTKDGEKDYSFGAQLTDEERRQFQQQQQQDDTQTEAERRTQEIRARDPRVRANVTWSPDSKTFFVTRTDMRKVKDLYLVNNLAEPRPTLMSYKYAMPGEPEDGVQEVYTLNLAKKELNKIDLNKYNDQRVFEMSWLEGSDRFRAVRRDRLQRDLDLIDVDPLTSNVKTLFTEQVEGAYLERQPIRYFKKKDGDFVWWSERDGWGHLYLYDTTGKLKNRITEGPWRVDGIADVNEDSGKIYFYGVGREPGENPYYRHLYSVDSNGKNLRLLDPGDADHNSRVSPTKKFFVDTYSRVDLAPHSVVLDENGKAVLDLEQQDTSKLIAWGWKAPELFTVKAADGVTDIYGVMWKPVDFDKNKQYPIVANVYPGPQTESVISTFAPTNTNQRLANLGMIVIQIGNRGGNPKRSNAYHSYGYYNLRDYGLADKKAGIEQLAAQYPWIDIDRVGIYGHSGGGFMSAAAMMLPPYNDFFKVAVASSGNHDNNIYNANWSEQHHGLKEVKDKDGNVKFDIKVPTNAELAANLKGKLLLVTGDMDNNVHPANTIRLVNALIKANKRFDFMIMPGQAHGYGPMQSYFTQMLMEYFAEHLIGDNYRHSAEMTNKG